MPQVGEIRRGSTESVQWDGSRWQPVEHQPQGEDAGFLSDLYHGVTEHPLDTLKGFLQGSATGLPTAARIAQVALPFVTAGASIPAQMAVGAGTQALADIADGVAGDPSAPKTFGDFLTHAATGAVAPGILGGAAKLVKAVRPLASKGSVGGVGGAALGAYEGYKRGGITGALEGAAIGGMGGSALANKLGKFGSAAAPEAEEAIEGGIGTQPKAPATGKNVYYHADEPLPQYGGSQGKTYYNQPAETVSPTTRTPSAAEKFNIERNAPYGEGAIMPSTVRPSEFRSPSLEGLDAPQSGKPADVDYYALTGKTHLPDVEPVSAGESVPQEQPTHDFVDQWLNEQSGKGFDWPEAGGRFEPDAAGSHKLVTDEALPDSLKAIDRMFGPGATDLSGAPLQSTSGFKGANNLLYDPQTPGSYLREQFLSAEDPAERDFLGRALRQRLRLGQSSLSVPSPR